MTSNTTEQALENLIQKTADYRQRFLTVLDPALIALQKPIPILSTGRRLSFLLCVHAKCRAMPPI